MRNGFEVARGSDSNMTTHATMQYEFNMSNPKFCQTPTSAQLRYITCLEITTECCLLLSDCSLRTLFSLAAARPALRIVLFRRPAEVRLLNALLACAH